MPTLLVEPEAIDVALIVAFMVALMLLDVALIVALVLLVLLDGGQAAKVIIPALPDVALIVALVLLLPVLPLLNPDVASIVAVACANRLASTLF